MNKSIILVAAAFCSNAFAAKYELTITNGGPMPISPAAVYVIKGQAAAVAPGQMASQGFVQLCQTGNGDARVPELKACPDVTFVTRTNGPVMPGESTTVEVEVQDPATQSVHFEAMYGKTKDLCSVGSVSGHSLIALQQHVVSEFIGKDDVLATGAFENPRMKYGACAMTPNAVSCLRELSSTAQGRVGFFSGYLPSVVNFLESKYGAAEVQSLVIPTSGAAQFSLRLKH